MRFPLRPFDRIPQIDFMAWRHFWVWSSAVMVVLTLVLLGFKGLNYGIDFTGGKLVQVQTERALPVAEVREAVERAGFAGASIQQYGAETEFLIRLPVEEAQVSEGSTAGSDAVLLAELGKLAKAEIRRVEFVGPQVGQELRIKGFTAMGVAILAILVYVWLRFEMRYGLGAILALVHDVVLTMGVMSLLGTEMTLTVLAALLTLIGYSLNDTIVIFDRIRENRGRYPNLPLIDVLNTSVNQTITRTIMTVSTVMLVLVALLIWGGEVIYDFALVLTIGTVLGTYSSVFVASPVLLALEEYYQRMAKNEAERSKV